MDYYISSQRSIFISKQAGIILKRRKLSSAIVSFSKHTHFYFSAQGIFTSYQQQFFRNVSSDKDQKNDNILHKKRSQAGRALTFKLGAQLKLEKSPFLPVKPAIEKLAIQSILKSNVIRHVLYNTGGARAPPVLAAPF